MKHTFSVLGDEGGESNLRKLEPRGDVDGAFA